jgi:hypothetical protein
MGMRRGGRSSEREWEEAEQEGGGGDLRGRDRRCGRRFVWGGYVGEAIQARLCSVTDRWGPQLECDGEPALATKLTEKKKTNNAPFVYPVMHRDALDPTVTA